MAALRLNGGRNRRPPPALIPQNDITLDINDSVKKKRRLSAGIWTKLLSTRRSDILTHSPRLLSLFLALLWITLLRQRIGKTSIPSVPTSPFEKRPVMLQSLNPARALALSIDTEDPPRFIKNRKNQYWINHGVSYHRPVTPQFDNTTECKPLEDWQDERDYGLTCLDFHAIHLEDDNVRQVGEGGFMIVWRVEEYNGAMVALKTQILNDDLGFNHYNFEDYRREALITSALTASPYVANYYGFCSHSSMAEYARGGILWWLFKKGGKEPSKDERFKIAYDVAAGVHDAHHYDAQGRATIAHTDIKANQFLWIDGVYKINDFNLARLLSWNVTSNTYCQYRSGYVGRWQAPEQYEEEEAVQMSEKADIFSMGYIFYFLLTRKKPFHDTDSEKAHELAVKGRKPRLRQDVLNSTHPFDVAVRTIMDKCFAMKPEGRPTSKEVREYLKNELLKAGLNTTLVERKSP
jgi:hypothetical protein